MPDAHSEASISIVVKPNGHGKNTSPTNAFVPASIVRKPTAAQQKAREEFVRQVGRKVSPERIEKIASQWSR